MRLIVLTILISQLFGLSCASMGRSRTPSASQFLRQDEAHSRIQFLFQQSSLTEWTFVDQNNKPISISTSLNQTKEEIRLLSPVYPHNNMRYGLRLHIQDAPEVLTTGKLPVAIALYTEDFQTNISQELIVIDLNNTVGEEAIKVENAMLAIEKDEFSKHAIIPGQGQKQRHKKFSSFLHVGYYGAFTTVTLKAIDRYTSQWPNSDFKKTKYLLCLDFITSAIFHSALSTSVEAQG